MMRLLAIALMTTACSPRASMESSRTGGPASLDVLTDAGPPDSSTDAAAIDAPVDAPPGEPGYEEHAAGPFVSLWNHIRQPMPYQADSGDHTLAIRLTGNNGNNPPGIDADGVELSFDGGLTWCGPAGRPFLSPVGSILDCMTGVTAVGVNDSLDLRLRLWNGYEGWDVQHEYYSVDGGPRIEVSN